MTEDGGTAGTESKNEFSVRPSNREGPLPALSKKEAPGIGRCWPPWRADETVHGIRCGQGEIGSEIVVGLSRMEGDGDEINNSTHLIEGEMRLGISQLTT
jgi:hypothetical protein